MNQETLKLYYKLRRMEINDLRQEKDFLTAKELRTLYLMLDNGF